MVTLLSLILLLVTGSVSLQSTVWALTGQQIASDLEAQLSPGSEIVLTSNATAYAGGNFTPRYDIAQSPSYTVAVKPVLAADVQKVVKYALLNNVSFLATGGGHGYSTSLCRLQGGIDLDLGAFSTVQVDSAAETMTIGGSVRSDQVASALQAAGMEAAVGQCSCIGFPGATLGGGIGPYSGLHGPMSDSLLSVEMITGRAELLNVSSTQYPDLFWAMKGAGFNYGVVTSLTYKIYPSTNGGQAMIAQMIFPGTLNGSVWTVVKSFAVSQPKELTISLEVAYDAALGGLVIIGNFIYAGPQTAGVALIQPFLDLQPLNVNISTVTWAEIPSVAFYGGIAKGGCTTGVVYVPYALNLYQVDVPNLVRVVDYLNATIATNTTLQGTTIAWAQYAPYGFQLRTDNSSAFPYRDVVAFVQVDGVGTSASQLPTLTEFGREIRDMLHYESGRDNLSVYVHFAHGDESPATLYSAAKVPGLAALKAVYDPWDLFSWYNPV